MEYAVTVYSTNDTEQNAALVQACHEEDMQEMAEYNAYCDHQGFQVLEGAVGFDRAVELQSWKEAA